MKRVFKAVVAAAVVCTVLLGLAACEVSKFDETKAISVTVRADGSGTKSAFMEIIGLKGKADPTGAITADTTAAVDAEVTGNPQAIAYESLGYVTDKAKMLKIDGVEATVANIQNGTYKISRPLSVVYKAATITSGINKHFFDFLMSKDAQDIIAAEGYVSMNDDAAAYTKPADLSGGIEISGSTSLQPLMEVLSEKFEEYHPNVTVTVAGGGSGQGYSNANGGVSDFGMISEEFNQAKAPDSVYSMVAKDGIAVIVNKKNPVGNLTMAQLKNIYDKESASPYANWAAITA